MSDSWIWGRRRRSEAIEMRFEQRSFAVRPRSKEPKTFTTEGTGVHRGTPQRFTLEALRNE